MFRLNRHGKCSAEFAAVSFDHQRQLKLIEPLSHHREADQAPPVFRHEVDSFGGYFLGGHYEVVHHTQFLAELVKDGRLRPAASDQTITYHDSCYLARHNDVMAEPRAIVSAVGVPLEMARREERTFCCGSGGAHMWLEERGNQINEERAREAVATGASTLAVACPFCTVMLDDGMQSVGGGLAVKDVATLLVEAVDRGKSGAAPAAAPD